MRRVLIERNRYFDSVFLMRIGTQIEELKGISHATVAMGTPANIENLAAVGFSFDELGAVGPQDLLIALDAESAEDGDAARDRLEELLAGASGESGTHEAKPMSLSEAMEIDAEANLALVSVPGRYAAREARQALRRELHVMLFSDNVSVEDEVALKREAIERGLLMMGPDCGTAILNGVPLGFANACRRGSIGIVGASGTGIQEISSLAHSRGGGISQAIGTGGRDLSSEVEASMTRFGIQALGEDDATRVIVVVSKAPDRSVIPGLLETLAQTGKPGVIHFVGFDPTEADPAWPSQSIRFAATLEEATSFACEQGGYAPEGPPASPMKATPIEGRILGLFCGGTLCQEAWALLTRAGIDVASNVAFDPARKIHPEMEAHGHALWDLGDDAFTVGRPHPMIEPELRDERVADAGADPEIGIVLADCVIGYGAHPDPATSLADAAREAIATARSDGRELLVVASVTGTDLDPQHAPTQREILREAGVIVAGSNANAVRIAARYCQGESR